MKVPTHSRPPVASTTGAFEGLAALLDSCRSRSWLGSPWCSHSGFAGRRLTASRRANPWLAALLALIAVLAPCRGAAAQDTGFIQVQCEPGVQIFLDGVLKGVSNRDQEGLIIEGVAVGTRIVKAVKPGFTPQEQRVSVGKGDVVVVRFAALRPKPVVEQGGDEQAAPIQLRVGSVLFKSLPVECTVDFERSDGSGGWDSVGRIEKTKPEARVSKLEIGTYRVTARRSNGTLTKTFDLAENDEVTVFFNFVGKSIEVTSAASVRAEEARRAEAARPAEEARRAELKRQADAAFVKAGGVLDLGSGVSMRFVEIKPGRFMMGSPASEQDRDGDETQHAVTISKPYWLGQTEVTQAQWQAVMGSNPSRFKGDLTRPVEQVSWNDAVEFCRRLSQKTGMTFRLPTEAEWEYACRAGTTTAYSFGNDASSLGEYGWFDGNAGFSTKPVATRKPNAWGLYDMHGNVWEWCSDWYGNYPSGAVSDPQGPVSGTGRVLRGGSWLNRSNLCRASFRFGLEPGLDNCAFGDLGFRAARTP